MLTTAAIDHLINRGKLSLRTKVYKRTGYFDAKDKRAMDITVKHLLEHKGRYDRREAGEDISVDSNKRTSFEAWISVAAVYWGYGAIMEECSAAFSHKASASTIAKFAGFHAVSGIGLRGNGYRQCDFEGARTHVKNNGNFGFAVVLNTRDFVFD
ncbi:penicillin-binding protein [Fusarium pseudoanthophilum]|uniref:Penicillin-binding protein n=1 Tax=Fusarium pseudoanthophilum TaxID=48495 RepID=A0A8H5UYQ7_9HYPO|nr:penicillin-binding protein [Fusarium pseudoanthophilum]